MTPARGSAPCRRRRRLLALTGALLPLLAAMAGAQVREVLRGARVMTGTGVVLDGGRIVIEDGRIADVSPGQDAGEEPGRDLRGFVITPGFIDAFCHAGLRLEADEMTASFMPGVRALESLDPLDPALRALPAAGVTTFLLAPGARNVVGGTAAILGSCGGTGAPAAIARDAGAVLNIGPEAMSGERRPTARAGAAEKLREWLRTGAVPEGVGAGPRSSPVTAALTARRIPALIVARRSDEIALATELARAHGLRLIIVGGDEADACREAILGCGAAVIAGPFRFDTKPETLRMPAALAAAGVPIAFGSHAPAGPPEGLRLAAALAVKHGLDRGAALRALTQGAAALLGLADRTGTLEAGRDADLAIFTGDPLDLRSRLVAVVSRGRVIFGALPDGDGGKEAR